MIIIDNFCLFCTEAYVVTPHLNRLDEIVQLRGHTIYFQTEIRKNYQTISIKYSLLSRALSGLLHCESKPFQF